VATAVFVLLHVPPDVTSESVIDEPRHTDGGPVITAGSGLTVTIAVVAQVVAEE
jgi:hypothetical protein